jgi:hypothetical protein
MKVEFLLFFLFEFEIVDVESSFASMRTFPLDVISNYGIFYISIHIVMIT